MLACSAGVRADCVLDHAKWIGVLERFNGSVERAGHMRMMGAGAGGLRRGAVTSSDGFVVRIRLGKVRTGMRLRTSFDSTDGEIVHGAGTGCGDAAGQRRRES